MSCLAYCYLAFDDAEAIAGAAGSASTIVATGIAGTGSGRVEAAICPRPNPSLPIVADCHIAGLPRLQSEAVRPWARSRLRCDPSVYGLLALVRHHQRYGVCARFDPGGGKPFHVMQRACGR